MGVVGAGRAGLRAGCAHSGGGVGVLLDGAGGGAGLCIGVAVLSCRTADGVDAGHGGVVGEGSCGAGGQADAEGEVEVGGAGEAGAQGETGWA